MVSAIGGLAVAGALGATVASVVGTPVVELVFGPEFAPVGDWLWRFAWVGTAALGLQVLTLSDLATGRRATAGVLAGVLAAVAGTLLTVRPDDPTRIVTLVAIVMTAGVLVGLGLHLRGPRPRHARQAP